MRRLIHGKAVALGACCLAAAGGVALAQTVDAKPHAETRQHAKVINRNSRLSTRAIVTKLEMALPWNNSNEMMDFEGRKFPVPLPSSAWLYSGSGGYRTNCKTAFSKDNNIATYQGANAYFQIDRYGTSGYFCPGELGGNGANGVPPASLHSTPGEFQVALNRIGGEILRSVGVNTVETAGWIRGTVANVTATFVLPTCAMSTGRHCGGVTKVVLVRAHRRVRGRTQWYPKATLTLVEATS